MENLNAPIGEALFTPDLMEGFDNDFERGPLFENEDYGTDEGASANEPYVGSEWEVMDRHYGYIDKDDNLYLNNEKQEFGAAEAIVDVLSKNPFYDLKFSDIETHKECLARYSKEDNIVILTVYRSGPDGIIESPPEKVESTFEDFESFDDNSISNFEYPNFQTEGNFASHESRAERSAETFHNSAEPATHIETSSQFQNEARKIAADTGITIVFNSPTSPDADPVFPERARVDTESQAIN